jgi:hypothetical protein
MTKGGLWRPGHDARRQSVLKGAKPKRNQRLLTVSSPSEVAPLVDRIREMAAVAVHALVKLTASELDGLEVLRKIKFDAIGWHPLDDPAHMDPYTLAYLAGHRDFSTTRRYVHPQADTVLAAFERAREARTSHSEVQGSHSFDHSLPNNAQKAPGIEEPNSFGFKGMNWSGREDSNLRPPGPEPRRSKKSTT